MFGKKQIFALLLALLLVTSAGVVAVGATADPLGSSTQAQTGEQTDVDDVDDVDEVYVEENGDAILVYEEAHDDADDADALAGEFGLETQSGLMHVLYSGTFDEFEDVDQDELGVAGDLSVKMTPESITSSGDLTTNTTDDVENLEATVENTRTRTTASSSADVTVSVATAENAPAVGSATVDAETKTTASTFTSAGSVSASLPADSVAAQGAGEHLEVTITETDGTYDLEVVEQTTVFDWERDSWDTRADAEASLESRYAGVAMGLGGTADVSLEEYDFEEGDSEHAVSLEYTVTFQDVKDQLASQLAQQLATNSEFDLDEHEAQSIADRIAALEVDRIHYSLDASGTDLSSEWDVAIDNYDELVLGFVEIAESVDDLDDDLADQYDEIGETIDAQNEADLVRTSSWNLSIDVEEDRTTYAFTGQSDADNWEAYVTELEDRGLEQYVGETTYEFDAQTVDDELEISYDYESSQDEMLDRALDQLIQSAEQDGDVDEDVVETVENVRNSEFEVAKLSASVDEESFEVRSAAMFDNLAALEGVPIETDDNLTVTAVHGETDDGTTTTYVTVEEFVGEDASESQIREHDRVGEETAVHEPGEWDREFPSIDDEAVQSYLGVADDGSLLPVDTPVAVALLAVIALVAAGAGVFYRRRS
ncbi:hypothetical protein ACFOZ7_17375 [Natribaculum luteum]|uniref:PGF-CTERM sorting domain-containing protein n=1 Tax=Natribaculum luteum TaxID=1586232 RepID=A0ABD5P2Y5_9EURY|nr:hypothetical protein [Natribaculum luteum]